MFDYHYIAIDLKSFYASVECQDRGLDPLTTNLVVADARRTEKTICLAVSPSLKSYGVSGRARLFEVVKQVREVNAQRLEALRKQSSRWWHAEQQTKRQGSWQAGRQTGRQAGRRGKQQTEIQETRHNHEQQQAEAQKSDCATPHYQAAHQAAQEAPPCQPLPYETDCTGRNLETYRPFEQTLFTGASFDNTVVQQNPQVELDYLIARPRMARYIEVSTEIYKVYLSFFAPQDIHVYSIDEVFIDISKYKNVYKMSATALASTVVSSVFRATGITATAGIGTNLFLAKVAMDVLAKHEEPDENGVRMACLNEQSYKERIWPHQPITDIWRVGRGYARRLAENGMFTMGDVALCSLGEKGRGGAGGAQIGAGQAQNGTEQAQTSAGQALRSVNQRAGQGAQQGAVGGAGQGEQQGAVGGAKLSARHNEDLLYRLFGKNAELLIDHAWGYEPVTMEDIKAYKPAVNCKASGQVLQCPYTVEKARIVVQEMADALAFDLLAEKLETDKLTLTVSYDRSCLEADTHGRGSAARGQTGQKQAAQKQTEYAPARKERGQEGRTLGYQGEVTLDWYGRAVPKHAHGTVNLNEYTSSSHTIMNAVLGLYDKIVDPHLLVRHLNISAERVISEEEAAYLKSHQQLTLFDWDNDLGEAVIAGDTSAKGTTSAAHNAGASSANAHSGTTIKNAVNNKEKEHCLHNTVLDVRNKFGKNAVLRATSLQEGATARQRNNQIGGHNA